MSIGASMKNEARPSNRCPFARRTTPGLAGLCFLSVALWGCGGLYNSGAAHSETLGKVAKAHRSSIAAGIAMGEATAALERGAPDEAASWLAGALQHRDDLLDDGVFRSLAARLDPGSLMAPLGAVRSTEMARRALLKDRLEKARQVAAAVRATPEASRLTHRRAEMIALLAQPESVVDPGSEAYAAEISRIRRQPIPGRLGAKLKLRLTVLEAAVHQEKGRHQEAIGLYLSVPMDSGMYRPARLGLAWCQFQIGHAQRALKILALLPGGLSADPERAVLAAMAAHALGEIDAAQAIIRDALNRRPDLEAEHVDLGAVLRVIEAGQVRPLLRGPAEGLTIMVAASAEVSAIAQASIEFREHAVGHALGYGERLTELLAKRVGEETERQRARLRRSWEALERLAPQIREGD